MSQIKRVVSIGAHSLDADLLGGPLLLKYARQGAHCTCLHVTQGRLEDPNATQEEKEMCIRDSGNSTPLSHSGAENRKGFSPAPAH